MTTVPAAVPTGVSVLVIVSCPRGPSSKEVVRVLNTKGVCTTIVPTFAGGEGVIVRTEVVAPGYPCVILSYGYGVETTIVSVGSTVPLVEYGCVFVKVSVAEGPKSIPVVILKR